MATHVAHDKPETEEQPTVKKLRIDEDAVSVESTEDKLESGNASAGESSAEEKDPEVAAITGGSRSSATPRGVTATPTPTPTAVGASSGFSAFGGFSSFSGSGFSGFAKTAESSETTSSSSGFAAFAKSADSSSGFGSSGFSSFAMASDSSSGFGAFAKTATDTSEGFGEAATADFDPNAEEPTVEFTPVVTLTEAEVANGEEEERIIVEKRAKLFKLVETDYVEVGIGPFRVLKPRDAKDIEQARASARMVMRRESHPHGPGTKLILNARLTAFVSCVKKSEKSLMVVIIEAPTEEDASTDPEAKPIKPVTYLLRFASHDDLLLVHDRVVDLLPAHASTS